MNLVESSELNGFHTIWVNWVIYVGHTAFL